MSGFRYCDLCGSDTHTEINHQNLKAEFCESERPNRKTICQKVKGHKGSCRAVIFWETK